jgi:hypothetical protein
MKLRPHVTWMDNFSKVYAAGLQGVVTGAYSQCLWTGVAMRPIDTNNGSVVDLTVANHGPAMPDDLFDPDSKWFKKVDIMMHPDGDVVDEKQYMEDSFVNKFKVCGVPLKPNPEYCFDAMREILKQRKDGMVNFHPLQILPSNIGSNRGLLIIMKDLEDEHKALPGPELYKIINSDPNIFNRMMKVFYFTVFVPLDECSHWIYVLTLQMFYDTSGCGIPVRKWMIASLGLWHPYKQATLCVWSLGAHTFFAPFYHCLIPGATFFKKPKLVTVVYLLTTARLAYPKFKTQLEAAIASHNTKPVEKKHLLNLQALFEFFIPAVNGDSISITE